tara:strand:- start:461 stop:1309 length:849 start_codon:yes stop_codon:yes gene_type:complete
MKIAIIGASGFLGTKLVNFFSKNNEVFGSDTKERRNLYKLDATKQEDVDKFFLKYNPEVVIDTVALTSSVTCERNPNLCKKLNYETAKNIAKGCKKIGARMVFISSSYIFDGKKGSYKETDKPSPKNEYGKQKILAEKEVLGVKDSIVVRVDVMYGLDESTGKIKVGTGLFNKEIIEMGDNDLIRSPLYIKDLPKIISTLLEKNQSGIFNVAGSKKINLFSFMEEVSSIIPNGPKIKLVDNSNWIVKSPKNSSLDISKINSLDIQTTSPEEALKELKKLTNH